jgi:hypothetical protein
MNEISIVYGSTQPGLHRQLVPINMGLLSERS